MKKPKGQTASVKLADDLVAASQVSIRGGYLLDHPAHAGAAQQIREALKGCRDQGLFPSWKAWSAVLRRRGVQVSESSVKRWCEADAESRAVLSEIRILDR